MTVNLADRVQFRIKPFIFRSVLYATLAVLIGSGVVYFSPLGWDLFYLISSIILIVVMAITSILVLLKVKKIKINNLCSDAPVVLDGEKLYLNHYEGYQEQYDIDQIIGVESTIETKGGYYMNYGWLKFYYVAGDKKHYTLIENVLNVDETANRIDEWLAKEVIKDNSEINLLRLEMKNSSFSFGFEANCIDIDK